MVAVIVLDLSLVLRAANVETLQFSSFRVTWTRQADFLLFLSTLLDASYMACSLVDPETKGGELDLLERR